MNPPPRRLTRLLTGIVAAGIVTATFLAPTTSAHAEAAPPPECVTLLGQLDAARDALRAAKVENRAARTDRRAARATYDAAPTRKHKQSLRAARAVVREARAARLTARSVYGLATTSYAACLPSVAVTNPRVAFYGSNFGIADITWSNVPHGEYHFFMRYDDAAAYQGPVTFVDVIPPPPPWDPRNPPEFINYRQNDVTNWGAYLGSGCDFTPGENVSVELWTGKEGTSPAGLKLASATVDNPCR